MSTTSSEANEEMGTAMSASGTTGRLWPSDLINNI